MIPSKEGPQFVLAIRRLCTTTQVAGNGKMFRIGKKQRWILRIYKTVSLNLVRKIMQLKDAFDNQLIFLLLIFNNEPLKITAEIL